MVLDLSVCEQKQSWEENKGDDDGPEENDTEEIPSTDPQETPVADIKQCNLSLEQLRIGEIYDVLDSSGRWCEGEVIKIDRTGNRVFVTYIYWDSRFDEWVDDIPHRIAPLHAHTFTQGGKLKVGQRVEVLDEVNIWREAFIIEETNDSVKVHYKGFHAKFDEWIRRSNIDRFAPYGRNKLTLRAKHMMWSTSTSTARSLPSFASSTSSSSGAAINRVRNIDEETRQRKIEFRSSQFLRYKKVLEDQGLLIVPVSGDGNCLFRSVSHQIYGTEEHHAIIRQKCLDYMEAESEFFSQFIVGGQEMFPLYLAAKRKAGCWGDDPEIQAICELYNRPAEIWAFDPKSGARKLRTFHESRVSHSGPAMRLSYYGGGHYDSIVDRDHSVHLCLKKPGELEDQRISWCRRRAMDGFNRRFTDVEASEAMIVELACKESRRIEAEREHDDLETTLMLSLQDSNDKRIGNDKALMDCKEVDALVTQGELLRSVQEESEREYLEKALVSSLPDGDATSSLKETTEPIDESMKLALELSNLTDEQVLELALKQSLQAVNGAEQINTMSGDMHDMYSSTVDEDEMLRRAIAASLESSRAPPDEDIDVYPEEDVDEDLLLAIQESLRK